MTRKGHRPSLLSPFTSGLLPWPVAKVAIFGAKPRSAVAAYRHGATMTGMIQHLPFAGLATVDWLQLNE
jgi:hypothetical protein